MCPPISSDDCSITITKEFPTEPPVEPGDGHRRHAVAADHRPIRPTARILYDLDAKTRTVIDNFSSESSLVGKYVRIAARYQEDGTLVAVRIWASSEFNNVWLSPEGHVMHVDADNDVVSVLENESGCGVPLTVNAGTQFFFRDPQNPAPRTLSRSRTGTGVPVKQESGARLQGACHRRRSAGDAARRPEHRHRDARNTAARSRRPASTDFTYTHDFRTAADDYVYTLDYISARRRTEG